MGADKHREESNRKMSTTEQAGPGMDQQSQQWHEIAQQLRVDSIRATTKAGSGHPTSSMSGADLMTGSVKAFSASVNSRCSFSAASIM